VADGAAVAAMGATLGAVASTGASLFSAFAVSDIR
jgi:hypothetical protein